MDIVIVTKVAQSVQRLHPHMREDVDTTHQYCVVNDARADQWIWSTAAAKHAVNAAISFNDFNCLNAYQ